MKKVLISVLLLFLFRAAICQQLTISAGYTHIYSPQFNRSVAMYNFSRPWLLNEQPNFGSGLFASSKLIFSSSANIASGMGARYSFHRSVAENAGFKSQLNFHLVELTYVLHLEPKSRGNHPYIDMEVGAVGGLMTRLINDENFQVDEEEYDEMGIGGIARITAGYLLKINDYWKMSPYLSIGFAPYFYMPDSESVINQTINLASEDNQPMLSGQIGVTFQYGKTNRRR